MPRTKIILILLAVVAVCTLAMPHLALAGVKSQLQNGVDAASGGSGSSDINTPIGKIVNLLSSIAGVLAVIMLIVGGLRYVTSGGNQESTKGAKNTILYALIGLVVVAIAQILVRFVLNIVS
jgi:hypothetical protein